MDRKLNYFKNENLKIVTVTSHAIFYLYYLNVLYADYKFLGDAVGLGTWLAILLIPSIALFGMVLFYKKQKWFSVFLIVGVLYWGYGFIVTFMDAVNYPPISNELPQLIYLGVVVSISLYFLFKIYLSIRNKRN